MLSEELRRKVKWIEIVTRRRVNDLMSGQYKSHFKGHGVQFSEHRQYCHGDDIRHIDWKVSARTRDPLIKKFEEERELTVFIAVDVSGSMLFGSGSKSKSEIAAEVGAMLAYAAALAGDRVGLLLFSDKINKVIVPKKGRVQTQKIILEILRHKPSEAATDFDLAGRTIDQLMKQNGVIFFLSDWLGGNFEKPLKKLGRRHDVTAIRVRDPLESEANLEGSWNFQDLESDLKGEYRIEHFQFQSLFSKFKSEHKENWTRALLGSRLENLELSTRDDYAHEVVRFFQKKKGSR